MDDECYCLLNNFVPLDIYFFLFSLLELNVLITGEIETLEQFLQIVLFNFFLHIKIIAFSYIMVFYIKYTF